jgi:hypothetical protein
MRKALLLYATGEAHQEMHRLTLPSKRAYAEAHGYDLIEPQIPDGGRHPSWEKVPILRRLLDEYDAALFLGADVWIRPGAPEIAAGVPPEAYQALVVHDIDAMPGTPRVGWVPNCDVWLTFPGLRDALGVIDGMSTQLAGHPWWEQAACMQLMGWDIHHPCIRQGASALWRRTFELDARFNHHPYAKCLGEPWFEHATGFAMPTRLSMVRGWVGA